MKHYRFIFLLLAIALGYLPGLAQQVQPLKKLTIGVVLDGPWETNDNMIANLQKEIAELLSGEADVQIPPEKILVNNWSLPGVKQLNNRLLNDPAIGLVIGLGVFASQDLATRKALPKPVIAPLIVDPYLQGVPDAGGKSGVHNLNYLKFPSTLQRDVAVFQEITPFKKLAILNSERFFKGLPALRISDAQLSQALGVQVVSVNVDLSATDALSAIPDDADAVYIQPLLHISSAEQMKLIEGINLRGLPSFSALGESEVTLGVLAGLNPSVLPRISRRIALNIHRILDGEDPADLPIAFPAGRRLFMNVKTVQEIGISPKWSMLLEANLVDIDTSRAGLPQFTLKSVMTDAIDANLDVRAKERAVAAGNQETKIARAPLLPQLDLAVDGTQIDKDQASLLQPERSATASLTLSQIILSEPALANASIQSSLQRSLESEFEQLRLDISLDAAAAYINFLRARKILSVQMDNLQITRTNLEIALVRRSTGAAGPDEPLRWETVLANSKIAALNAQSGTAQSALALNQVLNRPVKQRFAATDVKLNDPELLTSRASFLRYLEDPRNFQKLSDFLVENGLERSEEIVQLDALIAAQKRALTSNRLSYVLPTVSAFGRISNNFYRSETGGGAAIPGFSVPNNDNTWTAGVQLSLPLFTGLSRKATGEKTSQTIKQLQFQRQSVTEKLSLNIRATLENVKSGYFGIQQSQLAAEAARKNYQIVFDGYSQGTIPIINLLDAQEATLQAEQVAANAYFDFLVDYMDMQRAISQFDILLTPADRSEFANRLDAYMETQRP